MNEKNTTTKGTRFPIRELSARTRVNAVTIRAWERRYGLLKPERTDKGHRLYSDKDVATVENILALVARGVPLGKVKSLLHAETPVQIHNDETEHQSDSVAHFVAAAESFSPNKVEHLVSEWFASYPVRICSERWIEPAFSALLLRNDHKAAYGFAESELIRYAALRLSTNAKKRQRKRAVVLVAGEQTPLWRLAMMAMELADANICVTLLNCTFTVAAAMALACESGNATTVFYQDGQWNDTEKNTVATALTSNNQLLLCGTAPVLAKLAVKNQVFSDTNSCINTLL